MLGNAVLYFTFVLIGIGLFLESAPPMAISP